MLRDRSPLGPKPSFDLHFLGTPQAFVLSQDQTLHEWMPNIRDKADEGTSERVFGLGPEGQIRF